MRSGRRLAQTATFLAAVLTTVGGGASASARFAEAPGQQPAQSLSDVPEAGRGSPERTFENQNGQSFVDALARRNGERPPQMSADERRATRGRYDDIGPTEAADLARRVFPDELATPVFNVADPPGGKLLDVMGRFAAVVRDDDTHASELMLSSVPVRQPAAAGGDPVDLSLESVSGGERKPASPLIDTRVTNDAQEAVRFPGRDVSVGLATKSERAPLVRDDRATHFEASKDTDLIVTPRPEGAELYLQIRSADSPEAFLLDVDMPAGARLREVKPENPIGADRDGPWPIAVFDGDRELARVYPPATHDREGRPVPSRLSIDGGNIRLTVDHHGRPLAYPVLSDPEVYVRQTEYQPSSWSGWRQQIFRSGYSQQYGNYPNFGAALGNSAYGPGLYLSMPTNSAYYSGDFAEMIWQAPADTFITRGRFNWQGHAPYYSSVFEGITNKDNNAWEGGVGYVNQANGTGPNPFGVASQAFNGVTHDFCYGSPNCNLGGSDQNNLVVGLQATPPGCCMNTSTYKATMQANSIEIYLGDRYDPQLTGGVPASRDWYDDSSQRTHTVSPQASDRGLGLTKMQITGAGSAGNPEQTFGCTGHPYASPCPKSGSRSFSFQLPEGFNSMRAIGFDAAGRQTNGGTWTEAIDRTAPEITNVSGTLYDHRDRTGDSADHRFEGLYDSAYGFNVRARDTLSGIKSLEVFVDGQSQRSRGGYKEDTQCGSSCSQELSLDWNLSADDFADGEHTVAVLACDRVGGAGCSSSSPHARMSDPFKVTIDRRGDIVSAEQFEAQPGTDGGEVLATEAAQTTSFNARSEEAEYLTTRSTVACGTDRCADVRSRSLNSETDPAASDSYSRYVGTSEADSRLDLVSDLQRYRRQDLGTAIRTGPIADALLPWQRPTPAHGANYAFYETVDNNRTDDDAAVTSQIWLDAVTRMPLRVRTLVGSDVDADIRWTYGAERKLSAEVPDDFFAVARPNNVDDEESVNYSLDPAGEVFSDPPLDSDAPATQDEKVEEAVHFRSDFGLRDDIAFVRDTIANTSLNTDFSVPLLPDEVTEMRLRDQLQDKTNIVRDYGLTHASEYAGTYIDQPAGGLVRVGFTANLAQHEQALKSLFPYPDRIRVFLAGRTASTLRILEDQVSTDLSDLEAAGIPNTLLATDPATNQIVFGTDAPTEAMRSELERRYGAGLRLIEMAPAEPATDPPPLPGGIRIEHKLPNTNTVGTCSTSFSGRGVATRNGRRRAFYRVFTAGHCGKKGTQWLYRYVRDKKGPSGNFGTGTPFGKMTRRAKGGGDDQGVIYIPAAFKSFIVRRTDRYAAMKSVQVPYSGTSRDEGGKGDRVCMSGATSYTRFGKERCGRLLYDHVKHQTFKERDGSKYRVDNANIASYRGLLGDSGGAVFSKYGGQAQGIHLGGTPSNSTFLPIRVAARRLGGLQILTATGPK